MKLKFFDKTSKSKSKSKGKIKIKQKSKFNKKLALPFMVTFALIGAYFLYQSFAFTPTLKGNDGEFVALNPSRAIDTTIGAGSVYRHTVLGKNGVPASGVSAVLINLTAAGPTQNTYLTAYPSGTSLPNASSINANAGIDAIANQIVVKVGSDGAINIFNAAGNVRIVVDVSGFYSSELGTNGARYTSLAPSRMLEVTLNSGSEQILQIAGSNGVPASGVTAVSVNITAADATGSGFIIAYPSGTGRPWASTLNYTTKNYAIANQIITRVGTDGKIRIYNQGATARIIVDVAGYFTLDSVVTSPSQAGRFVSMSPLRIYDSTVNIGQTVTLGIPNSNISAVVMNLTAASPSANGYMVAYPSGQAVPGSSSVNYTRGTTATANQITTQIGKDGKVNVYNAGGSARLIADVSGYYISEQATMLVPSEPINAAWLKTEVSTYHEGGVLPYHPGGWPWADKSSPHTNDKREKDFGPINLGSNNRYLNTWAYLIPEEGMQVNLNAAVEVTDIGIAVLNKNTNSWTVFRGNEVTWGAVVDGWLSSGSNSFSGAISSTRGPAGGSLTWLGAGSWNKPTQFLKFHGSWYQIPYSGNEVKETVSWMKARLVTRTSGTDQTAQAKYVFGVGTDYEDSTTNRTCPCPGTAIGKHKYVTRDWRTFVASTMSPATVDQLAAARNLPPIPGIRY